MSSDHSVEYRVYRSNGGTADTVESDLAAWASDGWRVVCSYGPWLIMEKAHASDETRQKKT